MKITVTVKSEGAIRPSEHKLSPGFVGGIDYKETFTCTHAKEHADLFMKILDLSARQCGIETKEFPKDLVFTIQMDRIVEQIGDLHRYIKEGQRTL